MSHVSMRQRRPLREIPEDEASQEPMEETPTISLKDGDVSWLTACLVLMLARSFSANSNLIHDCDETYNYWEPLHYLLYGNGFQTWEYSAEFSLRSYLYLLLHYFILFPFKILWGDGPSKVYAFYVLRYVFAFFSAASEASLVTAVSRLVGRRAAGYSLLLLSLSHGCFVASTSFLPSTFSMYSLSLATGLFLQQRFHVAVSVAAVGVILGWPFSVLATAPLVLWALGMGGFVKVFLWGLVSSLGTLVPSICVDRLFYGCWTFSVMNLILYNVKGGGDSTLYGVENSLFYIRNLFNNFNFAFLSALFFPIVFISRIREKVYQLLFLAVFSPLLVWIGFMTLQPHKEERFLYIIYPILCVASAVTIDALPELLSLPLSLSLSLKDKLQRSPHFLQVLKWSRPLSLSLILLLSFSRTHSLLTNYGAPMRVYLHLPHTPSPAHSLGKSPPSQTQTAKSSQKVVCVGSEWHRFPSHFFLSFPEHKIVFLDDGFRGILPFPFDFDPSFKNTDSSPPHFNDRNQYSPKQFVESEEICDFLIELNLNREKILARGQNFSKWKVVYEEPFLDIEKSHSLYRAFYIPTISQKKNVFGKYRLLERIPNGEKNKNLDDGKLDGKLDRKFDGKLDGKLLDGKFDGKFDGILEGTLDESFDKKLDGNLVLDGNLNRKLDGNPDKNVVGEGQKETSIDEIGEQKPLGNDGIINEL